MTSRHLTRLEAAEYLTREGFPCSSKTLAKLACQGGGPTFIKFGLRVLYRPEDLISWAVSRCSARSSTSDQGRSLAPHCAPPPSRETNGAASPPAIESSGPVAGDGTSEDVA